MLLRFEVADTGPGIAPEEMKVLFQAFAQTRTGQQAQEGTGLGLAISRKFVQLMGGEISVESEPGCGTVFAFDIRATVARQIDQQEPTDQQQYRVVGLEDDQPVYRILVVDDLPDNRYLLKRLLKRVGFEVEEASDGQQAIEVWEQWEPHLIWMDMRMPVMDGYTATRHIKDTPKGHSTKIIALTASAFEDERSHILAAGCDDFVGKPFRDTDIFEHMSKHLGVKYRYKARKKVSELA
jgi:CheY-like chemotaxis protein